VIRSRRRWLAQAAALLLLWGPAITWGGDRRATDAGTRITVVYDNVQHARGLKTAWGFAAVVDSGGERVLFDTGGDGATLLSNLARLGIAPASIDAVVLSHFHADHIGGLEAFLAQRPTVTVYLPQSFPAEFQRLVERQGGIVDAVSGPRPLRANLHSTGEMGDATPEQALIVDTPAGLVILTGCAHPGVVAIARAARAYRRRDIHLLMGGFHLHARTPAALEATLRALQKLGVRRVAPSHCTGERAIQAFRARWGDDFVEGGCGAVIDVP
jgi:7,8-dihydropterin-6-yl-methyl-4-(beta-D-ribofuranosyl)aminobenzene 5'-phosphate synthase